MKPAYLRTAISVSLCLLLANCGKENDHQLSDSGSTQRWAISATKTNFKIYSPRDTDATIANLDPGLRTVTQYGFFRYNNGYDLSAPDYNTVVRTAQTWNEGVILVADIEEYFDQLTIQKHFHMVTDTLKATRPSIKMGYYSWFPRNTYWDFVPHLKNLDLIAAGKTPWNYEANFQAYQSWMNWNAAYRAPDAYSSTPLGSKLDYTFPSCYTFYRDAVNYPNVMSDPGVKDWDYFCKGQIQEARKFGKPVIAFVWPMYHTGGSYKEWGHLVEGEFFAHQLELVYEYADAVIIWDEMVMTSGYQNTPWHAALQNFITQVKTPAIPPRDSVAPVVAITSPANGATVSGALTISVMASDNVGVSKVELYRNGAVVETKTAAPYNFAFDSKAIADGTYAFMAKAYDAAGNSGMTSGFNLVVKNAPPADTTAPTVVITSPVNGAKVSRGATLSILANASDNVGVKYVEMYIEGTFICRSTAAASPYLCTYVLPKAKNRTFSITAKAYDAAGNIGNSAAVKVTTRN